MGSAEALLQMKRIAGRNSSPCVVVASAMSGMTNRLNDIFGAAVRKGAGFEEEWTS